MKTILVLAGDSSLPDAVRSVLDPNDYRVIHHQEVWAAEPLFSRSLFDACFLDAEAGDVRTLRTIEQLKRTTLQCPLFVFAPPSQREWEEDAYLLGVDHVFAKPVRAKLLNALLERSWRKRAGMDVSPPVMRAVPETPLPAPVWGSPKTLEVLRDFSRVLTHSLQTESLLKQFLLLLREVIHVNRAAIFLRSPESVSGAPGRTHSNRRLPAACALGLAPALLEHFELSLDAGIGGHALRHGRILKSGSDEARSGADIQKEFELLGTQVAIPILDRENLVGVAVFDGRLTGEFFANEELALIFHLLEGLGLAIKNTWLHDELTANHHMMADVLNQLGSGCAVVAKDLTILHANQTARNYFKRLHGSPANLEFSDLPQGLAGKVYESLQKGTVLPAFKYHPTDAPETIYRVQITPFKRANSHTPDAVMLLIEDYTQNERSQKLEIETANLETIKSLAEHLAHEIGNSLVPILTYQQLAESGESDPEAAATISNAMHDGTRRIARLASQMRFLAHGDNQGSDKVVVARLIEDAFHEAQINQPDKPGRLNCEEDQRASIVLGDYHGLRHALSEIMLNALRAAPSNAVIRVRSRSEQDEKGGHWLQIEVEDGGNEISAETPRGTAEPLFTNRLVGTALGLTVSRKIVESHQGRLEIVPRQNRQPGLVRISLPLAATNPPPETNGDLAAA